MKGVIYNHTRTEVLYQFEFESSITNVPTIIEWNGKLCPLWGDDYPSGIYFYEVPVSV